MTYALRDYQMAAQAAVREHWASGADTSPMLVLATGTGKTEVGLGLVAEAVERGERVVWLSHRKELVSEPIARFCHYFPHLRKYAGIVRAGDDHPHARFVSASVQTLLVERRIAALLAHGAISLLVCDEIHHDTSASHEGVIEALRPARLLGLTATPHREDGGDLSRRWEIAFSYDIVRAIAEGWLVPPYAVVDRLGALPAAADDRLDYIDATDSADALVEAVVAHTVAVLGRDHVATRLPDRNATATLRPAHALVITTSVKQAERTVAELGRGAVVSGTTPDDDRRALLKRFDRDGGVLASADALREGTDMPRIDTVVIARSMKSWSLAIQSIGRGLRLWHPSLPKHEWNAHNPGYQAGGKRACLLIDLSGCTDLHPLSAPPVLIGGSPCDRAPTGVHNFVADGDVRGICTWCERTIACLALLGSHEWDDDGRCKACQTVQCPDSETNRHVWVPTVEEERPFRLCMCCGSKLPDPLGGMVGRTAVDLSIPRAWVRLFGVEPETWAIDATPRGMVLATTSDRSRWTPYWIPSNRHRKPRAFYRDVDGPRVDEAATFILDMTSRSAVVAPRELRAFFRHARDRAISLGVGSRKGSEWNRSPAEPARNLPWRTA